MQHAQRAAAAALLAAPDTQRSAVQFPRAAVALPAAHLRTLLDADATSALRRCFEQQAAPPRHAASRAEPAVALPAAAPRPRGVWARLAGAVPRRSAPAAPLCAAAVAADLAWAAHFVDVPQSAGEAVASDVPAWMALWRYQGL